MELVAYCTKCFKEVKDCRCNGKQARCLDFVYKAFKSLKPQLPQKKAC